MKKLSVILIVTLIFTACSPNAQQVTQSITETAAVTATIEPELTSTPLPADTPMSDPTSTHAPKINAISEQILYEDHRIRIIAKSLYNGDWGPELDLLIENDSDTVLAVELRVCSINGLVMDGMFSCNVYPGKKYDNDGIVFLSQELEQANIQEIQYIEFELSLTDNADLASSQNIHFITLKTNAYG